MGFDGHVTEFLPGYVLGCLDLDERQLVEEHLEMCLDCRRELHSYQETAGLLAFSVAQVAPPAELKEKVMARVGRTSRRENIPAISARWKRSFRQFIADFTPVWAVASLLLVLFLAASNLILWGQMREMRADLVTPLRVVPLAGTDESPVASGVIVISQDGRHGTLVVDHLAALSEEQQYQLWLIRDGERISGAVFSVGQDGYASTYIKAPRPLIEFDGFGVTIEPAGGSPAPTGRKVLGGDL